MPTSLSAVEIHQPKQQHQLPRSTSVPLWSRLWSTWFPPSSSSISPRTPSIDRLHVISRRVTAPGGFFEANRDGFSPGVSFSASTSSFPSSPTDLLEDVNACSNAENAKEENVSSFKTWENLHASNGSSFYVYSAENVEKVGAPPNSRQIYESCDGTIYGIDSKLQRIRKCPIPQDPFLSPYLASDELFSLLPPLAIVVRHSEAIHRGLDFFIGLVRTYKSRLNGLCYL
ncbi:unnamed protein product [Hydatigera taeniaeformis]|uniref:Uncharacterized protein n=1 Tax=Hydatigena taeniaeformis TaxID=6205 RepID=A0A0R3WZ17_HYDTA|nr:unnamed protein product [Hydatigera taeniaeformis]